MSLQEQGGIKKNESKDGVSIPTSFSAGLNEDARPRTSLPISPNKLKNIPFKEHQYQRTKQENSERN